MNIKQQLEEKKKHALTYITYTHTFIYIERETET